MNGDVQNLATHSTPMEALEQKLGLGQRLVVSLIRGYQLTLSPYIGRQCRFYPSCSHYASEAVAKHGLGSGSWLATKRVARCHPLNPGGIDLVPEPKSTRAI